MQTNHVAGNLLAFALAVTVALGMVNGSCSAVDPNPPDPHCPDGGKNCVEAQQADQDETPDAGIEGGP